MRASRQPILCGVILSGFLALRADEPPGTPLGQWISPNGAYIARFELLQAAAPVRLTVAPSKPDKTIVPLKQQFDSLPCSTWNSPCQGIWNASGDQFCLFQAARISNQSCTLTATIVTIKPPVPTFPGDKELPQFVVSKILTADWDSESVADRLADLHPRFSLITDEGSGLKSGRWIGTHQAEAQVELDEKVQDAKDQKVTGYQATWTVTYDLTETGFKPGAMGPVRLVKIDPQTREQTEMTLPGPSLSDDLRSAARANDTEQARKLLAQGADPNLDSAALSPLALAAQHENLEMVSLLVQAGARAGDWEICSALTQYNPAIVDKIFDSSPRLSDEEVYWEYSILFFGPPQGIKRLDQWQSIFAHVSDRYAQSGASPNARDPKTGDTILMAALKKEVPISFLEKLIKQGADPALKNLAGLSAVDLAAKEFQIPALRLLDQKGRYADLIRQYDIPANSPFLGSGTEGDYLAILTLNPDSSGTFRSMFGGNVTWKQVGQKAELQIHVMAAQNQVKILIASARLSGDQKTLFLKYTDGPVNPASLKGPEEEFQKGHGDFP